MTQRYTTGTDDEREKAVAAASLAIQRGELIVIPTDTVYGLAADAFDSDAVEALLDAKERGRDMPAPVLVSSATTLDALAVRVPAYARALVEAFWPGPLTIVCHQQTSLQWDLGDTRGTVAVRMPDHEIALEILERTGPLAVSSANISGQPAATDADEAHRMLKDEAEVIVDAGPSPRGEASTIVDATGPRPQVLRHGAITDDQLDEVLASLGLSLSGEDVPIPPTAPAAEPTAKPTAKDPAKDPAVDPAEDPAEDPQPIDEPTVEAATTDPVVTPYETLPPPDGDLPEPEAILEVPAAEPVEPVEPVVSRVTRQTRADRAAAKRNVETKPPPTSPTG